jgi:hypothetical protein
VLSRVAGRLITGPLAFLLAGAIDVSAFVLGALARRAVARTARVLSTIFDQ